MSRPLQVYLEDDELERLERWTQARGWTKSRAVRTAIRALVRAPAEDPLLELAGSIDGLPADASVNFDRYLDETFVCERSPSYGRARRSRSRIRR
jgi:hypothetical protein